MRSSKLFLSFEECHLTRIKNHYFKLVLLFFTARPRGTHNGAPLKPLGHHSIMILNPLKPLENYTIHYFRWVSGEHFINPRDAKNRYPLG